MRIFSYIVARDYGFAPNPFYGYCTLATCKPRIRSAAAAGDWVVGTGAKTRYDLAGRLIYAMQVSEHMDFDTYWADSRFVAKRPFLGGSLKQAYGDNIYHREHGIWIQADSHHSLHDGSPNPANVARDTSSNRVLIGCRFSYFGSAAPRIPMRLRRFGLRERDLCCRSQGHQILAEDFAKVLEEWLAARGTWGLVGLPLEFRSHSRIDRAEL